MDYNFFLQELRKTRKRKGISLREVGNAIGITGQQVSVIERGITELKMKDYFLICDVLKISPRELIDGDIPRGEYQTVVEKLRNLNERDFRIIRDLIMLMELPKEEL
ncbi:MAG: helix-turn-helix transcriptional regulator [Clostridia bacterium]|nr:helix-turn-helix transcriptional regulator [Clostridia bacterium]